MSGKRIFIAHLWHVETAVILSQRKADDYIEVELDLNELDITSAEIKRLMQRKRIMA